MRGLRSHLATALVAASLGALVGGPVSVGGATEATQGAFYRERTFTHTFTYREDTPFTHVRRETCTLKLFVQKAQAPSGMFYMRGGVVPSRFGCAATFDSVRAEGLFQLDGRMVSTSARVQDPNSYWLRAEVGGRPVGRVLRVNGTVHLVEFETYSGCVEDCVWTGTLLVP